MTWTLTPMDFGTHLLVRVHHDGEQAGVLLLRPHAFTDLRDRLTDDPDEQDLHDLHPAPGQAAAAPLPAGVEGFAPGHHPRRTLCEALA